MRIWLEGMNDSFTPQLLATCTHSYVFKTSYMSGFNSVTVMSISSHDLICGIIDNK